MAQNALELLLGAVAKTREPMRRHGCAKHVGTTQFLMNAEVGEVIVKTVAAVAGGQGLEHAAQAVLAGADGRNANPANGGIVDAAAFEIRIAVTRDGDFGPTGYTATLGRNGKGVQDADGDRDLARWSFLGEIQLGLAQMEESESA